MHDYFSVQTNCVFLESPVIIAPSGNPCIPSPCGPNSQCRVIGDVPACSCLPNYTGRSPNCRPECMINAECPANLACINEKCKDPCVGSCGVNSLCTVIKHNPVCQCQIGFTGDPFTRCVEIQQSMFSVLRVNVQSSFSCLFFFFNFHFIN
jgi:hypothetical protein